MPSVQAWYAPTPPKGTTPRGRLRETLEVVEHGWTRRMIQADHPVYSGRLAWDRNWEQDGVRDDGNVLGLYVIRGLGKLAWLLPESGAAKYFRGTVLPRMMASRDPDGYIGCRDAGEHHHPCWEFYAESDALETLLFEHRLTEDPEVAEAARRLSGFLVNDVDYMGGKDYPGMPSLTPSGGRRWDSATALFRGMLQEAFALTGDQRIPARLLYCHSCIREAVHQELKNIKHMVGVSQTIQAGARMSLLTRDPADLAMALCGAEQIMRVAEQVSGYPVGWERYDTADPRKTTEHCNFVEWPSACRALFSVTGNVRYADWAERSLYNGYWGSKSKDGLSLQYMSAPNQIVLAPWMPTKDAYDVNTSNHGWLDMQHTPGCCNSFTSEAFPRHVEQAVARGRDGAVAIVYYLPCRFDVPLDKGNALTVKMDTDYPFEDTVRMELQLTEPACFPLELRVPTWTRGVTISVNGSEVDGIIFPGSMHRVEREWRSGDVVEVTFDFPVQLSWHREADCVPGAAVQRGPLVYALPVEAHWEYAGKDQPTQDNIAERWHLFPEEEAPWNVALDLEPGDPERACELIRLPVPAEAKAWQAAPVGLRVRGYRVPGWQMAGPPDKPLTPSMPTREDFVCDSDALDITLVPMGFTNLRMTCLPLTSSWPHARSLENRDERR